MSGLKSVFLLIISLFLVSCGSFNHFKKPAGNSEEKNTDQIKLSSIESELADVKQEQADLKRQVENKDTTIDKLQHNISRLEKKILSLEKSKLSVTPVQYKIKYKTPGDLYKKARNLLIEEDYVNAAAFFTQFHQTHPKNSLADNAVYWLGECHYSLTDYKKAILIFKDLVDQYPKSEKVPDAILKTGYSYLLLDDTNRSHHYLKQVLTQYPFSPAAEKAQKKLRSFE